MSFKITSLGHSCILIETYEGERLLFDPYLSGNESAVVSPEEIKNIDAILVSHGAFDHLGDAVPIAKNTGALLYCGPDVYDYALYHGIKKEQLKMLVWGTCLQHKNITIRSIEAKHISYFKCGEHKITGIPMSYVVTLEDETAIYFSGDTSIFSDMSLFGRLYNVKYGFFGISGLPGFPYEMDSNEGAMAASLFGVKVAIPIHYPPDTNFPKEFEQELLKLNPNARTVILKPGESYLAE